MNKHRLSILLIAAVLLLPSIREKILLEPTHAADFELSNPGIELRRLQICKNCSEPLVVTSIAPGAAVRCPKCQQVQRRLPDSELIIKVYQICPSCSQRLDVSHLKPNEAFRCGACNHEQRVLPQAVYIPPENAGKGKIPAKITIEPGAKLLPQPRNEIPEAVVPGLNAPEGEITEEFDIDIETPSSDRQTSDNKGRDTAKPEESQNNNSDKSNDGVRTSGAYLNLPDIDNDIEGSITISVNAEPIYESSIMRRIMSKFEDYQANENSQLSLQDKAQLYTRFRNEAEDELINETLINQQAKLQNITADNSKQQSSSQRLAFYKTALSSGMKDQISLPGNSALMSHYKQNIREYSHPDQYILDSIVIYNERTGRRDTRSSRIIADEIKERLDKGVDFTLMASRYSEGPFHSEGGRIRRINSEYIPANFLIKPLRQAPESIQSGDMFGPIMLPSCKLFVQISDVKTGSPKAFNTVREELISDITRSSIDQIFNQWLSGIRKAAVIEYKR